MEKVKELLQKIKDQYKKKPVIIATAAAAVVLVIIICIVVFTQPADDKKPEATSTPAPTQTADVTSPAVSAEAVTTEAVTATPQATVAPTQTPSSTDSEATAIEEIDRSNLTIADPLEEQKAKQSEFDQHITDKNYTAAYDVLENYYKEDHYSNRTLDTFNNYVKYYEAQGNYTECIKFVLDYIEQHDGIVNVRKESLHYQKLVELLELVPDYQDTRIAEIEKSVKRWRELANLMTQKDYASVVRKAKSYIKNGPECITAYFYLAEAYNMLEKHFEESKVYYIYLSKYSNNYTLTLEESYLSLFETRINALFDTGKITDDEKTYLEEELDLNYFN